MLRPVNLKWRRREWHFDAELPAMFRVNQIRARLAIVWIENRGLAGLKFAARCD